MENKQCAMIDSAMGDDRMKKFFMGILAVCLAGCSSAAPAASEQPSASASAGPTSVWSHDPDMNFDKASDLTPFNYEIVSASSAAFGEVTLYVETEKSGYPGEWGNTGYAGDVMMVEEKNNQGIYAHDGSEIYAVSVNKVSTPYIAGIIPGIYKDTTGKAKVAYGFANTATGKAQIFSSDFKSVSEVSIDQFNYDVEIKDTDPYLAYKNGQLGIAGMTHSASGAMSGWAFEAYMPTGLSADMIVPVIDDSFAVTAQAIISPDGTYVTELNTAMSYRKGSYVNHYYVVSDGTYASIVDAASGQNVATQYQDAKYFEDGYAPVKKSGKWGYIDQTGKEVTDFIFDDACTVFNGYAWVLYQGKYGIINLSDTLKDTEKQINAYWCAPSNEDTIGTLTIKASDLTIRRGAGTDSDQAGISMEGAVYPVFEKKVNGDYTWYRINAEEWIANEGTWAVFEETK